MKNNVKFFPVLLVLLLVGFGTARAYTEVCQVTQKDIREGYFTKRIWLQSYARPEISLSSLLCINGQALPADAKKGDPQKFQLVMGMERKRAFAVVRIPVYIKGEGNGQFSQLSSFSINIEEQTATAAKTTGTSTDVLNSVLATGTWFKIGVAETGFYKLDVAFFSAMGIDVSTIDPTNIRVFGNGGNMLSENNAVPRLTDLTENAILVNDGGDGKFNNSDNVIFYATGPMGWSKDSANQRFIHKKNLYSDSAYYFVSVNSGTGKRIQVQSAAPTPNYNSTSFNYYFAHDVDLMNNSTYGKTWYGEQYSIQVGTTQTFSFDLGDVVNNLFCKLYFGCTQQSAGSSVSLTLNGAPMGYADFQYTATKGDAIMTHGGFAQSVGCNSRTANIGLNFSPADPSAVAYLDYIELNGRRSLSITGSQMSFRDWQTVGAGRIAGYTLTGANGNTSVWDVTNPQVPEIMQGALSGSNYTFAQNASMLHEFAVINSTSLLTPKFIGSVPNQNLHGSPQVDLIIVVNPAFLEAAKKVRDFHETNDNMRVLLATTDQVFNEFSSGGQDISAIRDLARMFYKRADTNVADMPKYLLLYGTASYDYKNRVANNTNFVPTYETANDSSDLDGFVSDDFFGFLDDNENVENFGIINTLDVGVGRIPCRNATDAMIAANKIISYKAAATLGPWRIGAMFVADDNDGAGNHMLDAESMANTVKGSAKGLYNEQKVYVNAIPKVSTPAGVRCPNANSSINEQIYKGVFMVNYNGHGNPQVWAGERILTQDDFNYWNNANMLPFMTTATCDFGQFDHPQNVSAAEQLVLREGGGVIAIVTTTGAVFSTWNEPMNKDFISGQFTRNANGVWNTFGDAVRISKNSDYINTPGADETSNFRKFALLGDPALTPDFPQHHVHLDSMIDGASMELADTIKALGKYIIKGSVRDNDGQTISTFNGNLTVAYYDKARSTTITSYDGSHQTFSIQDNLVYKGKVTVTNGTFSLTFIAPKDINYVFGKGKLSTYAENGITDAAGADTSVVIGGFSDNPVVSSTPPVVKAYINDSLFVNGGITGTNTSLFVDLKSETGINVSGYSIGHNLLAYLDSNIEQAYILNDYYETAPNTYQQGYVSFPIQGIPDGRHTITVRAWDVNNRPGEGTVDFVVIDGKIVDIQNLGNYPNPFSGLTHFVFEHNHPDEQMNVEIDIFNTAGALAKTLKQQFTPQSSRSTELTWDGTDNNGSLLPAGVYVYRLNITTEKGFKSSAYQKLVIVR